MTEPTVDELLQEMERQLQIVVKGIEGAQAEMVAAVIAEREACAKVAEGLRETGRVYQDFEYGYNEACGDIASQIRARAGASN